MTPGASSIPHEDAGDDDGGDGRARSLRGGARGDIDCRSSIEGPGEGEYGCVADVPAGVDVEAVHGFCKDPANPAIIYLVAPAGMPYEMDKYVVNLVEEVELAVVNALP